MREVKGHETVWMKQHEPSGEKAIKILPSFRPPHPIYHESLKSSTIAELFTLLCSLTLTAIFQTLPTSRELLEISDKLVILHTDSSC